MDSNQGIPSIPSVSLEFADDSTAVSSTARRSSYLLRTIPFNPEKNTKKSSNRHIWGFYCYSIASEIYSIVSTSLFLPIALEQFAKNNGFMYPDYKEICPDSSKQKMGMASELNSVARQGAICKVKILGVWVNTASFPLYVSSLAVAALALVIISISSAGENEKMRKLLLITFAIVGSMAASLFFFVESSSPYWWIVGFSALISNVSLGASVVCLNSLLSRISRERVAMMKKGVDEQEDDRASKLSISQCTSHISSRGIAYGFASGILALCLCLALVVYRKGDLTSLKWAIGGSALCWGLLTIPAAMWIPPSEILELRDFSNPFQPVKSSKEIFKLFKGYRSYFETIKFLCAWSFLSNGYSTMTSTAIIFAKAHLKMDPSKLILIGVLTPSMGILGALSLPFIQRKSSLFSGVDSNLKILKGVVIPTCLIPLYISSSKICGTLALSTEKEMYLVAGFFGFFYGGFQSYSRAVYTQLIPAGQEAKWNSLFSVTAKFSGSSGPLIVGIITECTHDMRCGFLLILALLLASLVLLQRLNMEKGIKDAENYASDSQRVNLMEETSHLLLSTKYEFDSN